MKLQTRINLYSLSILSLLTFSIISIGTLVITDILFKLNRNRLTIEINHIFDNINNNYGILKRVGIDEIPHYTQRMQKKLLKEFNGYSFGKTGVLTIYRDTDLKRIFSSSDRSYCPFPKNLYHENDFDCFSLDGQKYCGLFKRFEPWGWLVWLTVTRSELYAERTRFLIQVSLIGFLVLLLNIFLWTRIVRRLTARIDQTLECARQVADGDLGARIDSILHDDEMGSLQEKINYMIAGFEARTNESRKSRHALEESRNRYLSYIENAPDGVFIIDGASQFIEVNLATSRMSGYDESALLEMKFISLTFENEREAVELLFIELIRTGRMNAEMRLKRKNNEECFWIVEAVRLSGDRYLCFAKDITRRKKMEFQLKHTSKMEALGTLASGIAHDFNNVLGIIMGNIEMAVKELEPSHPVQAKLMDSHLGCLRAKNVVKRILRFSRKDDIKQQQLRITPVIRDAMMLLRTTMPAHIELQTDFSAGSDWVIADSTDIDQMVMNLCTNAIHAMKKSGGILSVSVSNIRAGKETEVLYPGLTTPGVYVLLSVEDTGGGIPLSIIDKLFDPYFTTKPAEEGTGMGLAMVHGIVRNSNGKIFASNTEGKGACFKILLPVAEPENIEARPPVENDVRQGVLTGTEKLLLIDDEVPLLKLCKEMLEKLGYQVDEYENPVEACQQFKDHEADYHLVITDMNMPQMNGDEVIDHVRRIRSEIPVIVATGFGDAMTDEEARQKGIHSILVKPYAQSDLGMAVRRALEDRKVSPAPPFLSADVK